MPYPDEVQRFDELQPGETVRAFHINQMYSAIRVYEWRNLNPWMRSPSVTTSNPFDVQVCPWLVFLYRATVQIPLTGATVVYSAYHTIEPYSVPAWVVERQFFYGNHFLIQTQWLDSPEDYLLNRPVGVSIVDARAGRLKITAEVGSYLPPNMPTSLQLSVLFFGE